MIHSDNADDEEFFDTMEHGQAEEDQEDDNDDGSSSSSSLSSESSSESQQPRQRHSYLPGPSHPLLHEGSTVLPQNSTDGDPSSATFATTEAQGSSTTTTANQKDEPTTELAILELPGLILFPGASIPIRLQNRSWIQHLGRQIDASRKVGSMDFGRVVQLGIITRQELDIHNPTVTRARFEDGRRRSSFLRRGVRNSRQQQRLSRILLQELSEAGDSILDDSSSDDNDNHDDRGQRRPPQHPFIGRVGTIATVTYTHGDAVLDHQLRNSSNTNSNRVWQQHAEQQGELILQAVGTTRFRVESYIDFQSFADVQVFRVRQFQQDQHPLSCPSLSHVIPRRKLTVDPTLFDDDETTIQNNATTISSASDTSTTMNASRRSSKVARTHPTSSTFASTRINAKYYASHHESLIRQLATVTPTPYLVYRQVWPWRLVAQMVTTIQEKGGRHPASTATTTSLLTSLAELLRDPETASLPDNPTAFSFWLAFQMPLSVDDKYHLLQLPTTVERLVKLQQHLQDFASRPAAICCKSCNIPLSTVDCVFTVGGAEGTTGNFVNEHGFIHQVVTLRTVEDEHRKLYLSGAASTANSYFPGYSWTITYCARCGSLLGWKFNWVGLEDGDDDSNADTDVGGGMEEEENATTTTGRSRATRRRRSSRRQSENRPSTFFGFMSSSLIIDQSP